VGGTTTDGSRRSRGAAIREVLDEPPIAGSFHMLRGVIASCTELQAGMDDAFTKARKRQLARLGGAKPPGKYYQCRHAKVQLPPKPFLLHDVVSAPRKIWSHEIDRPAAASIGAGRPDLNRVCGRCEMLLPKARSLLVGALALGACAVAPPTGPTILALPTAGKDLAQFQREDTTCRGYAQQQISYGVSQQTMNQSAMGTAAAGTALGAAAGAAIGAAAGAPGTGAAVGGATGLLAGSSLAASNAATSADVLQQNYDVAYAQCMAASGNQVQPLPLALYSAYYAPWLYPYPAYYAPWFDSTLGFAFFGGFGPRFHNHVFFHEHHEFFVHGSGHGSHRG
jgi:hypothetical protein